MVLTVPPFCKGASLSQFKRPIFGFAHFRFSAKNYDVLHRALPNVPVPPLRETLDKYLRYVTVVSNVKDLAITRRYVEEFADTDGAVLDQKLRAIAATEQNWVNPFWIKEMYLGNRLPLPIYSNPGFLLPRQNYSSEEEMTRFVAFFVHGVYDYKEKIDKRLIPPDLTTGLNKGQPLCMTQYWNLFTSYRRPGSSVDQLDTDANAELNGSEHVIVLNNNQAYVVQTVSNNRLRSQPEIAEELLQIMAIKNNSTSVRSVGVYTSADRVKAYTAYQLLLEESENETFLDMIRSSSFIICLDKATDYPKGGDPDDPAVTSMHLSYMISGGGRHRSSCNRWFEKTLQFIFTRDGLCGINYEHTVAEGIPLIHLAEHVVNYIKNRQPQVSQRRPSVACPKRLEWIVDSQLRQLLEECEEDVEKLANSLDVEVLLFNKYGKNYVKNKNISPDVFVQLALQLAYYRCHGRLTSTYESGTLRRFVRGRVENIRAATPEALAWVKVMDRSDVPKDIKLAAYKSAIKMQTTVMQQAINGYGIDNYLTALRDLATEHLQKMPKIFEDPNFAKCFRFPLSTSQVNTSIASVIVGYGPVLDDGYGCGYRMQPNEIFFVVSSSRNCQATSSSRFRKTLEQVLMDLRNFIQDSK